MSVATQSAVFQVSAVPPAELRRIRAQQHDDHGNPLIGVVDEVGGAPLRCCLRDSHPGERIALIAYSPASRPGPYAAVGPIYIHEQACAGYPDQSRYPEAFRGRAQVFRAHRADGTIAGGEVLHPGDSPEELAARLLADPEIDLVHARNVVYGCFMFEIR
ncbi:MAG: DUF1203 domain-containing protein [Actinomycetota bacterium]|nr:DUF1203 domain-containing protein [Actinomycetota bacterium]